MEWTTWVLIIMVVLLPYGYVLVGVMSAAYFKAKLLYHKQIIQQLGPISEKTGGKR